MLSRGLAGLLAAGLALLTATALAQSPAPSAGDPSPFVGRAVAVDITAPSAAQAREQAIAEAERLAVQQVLQRLTLAVDHPRLPRPTGAQLQSLIEGMEVRSERGSATRYIASIDVAFRRAGIRALLRQADILFAETRAQPTLLLPLFVQGGQLVLFEAENPWAMAWAAQAVQAGLRPLILPLADAEDRAALTADQARGALPEHIQPLANRYASDGAVLAEAILGEAPGGLTLDLTLRPLGRTAEPALVRRLQAAPETAAGPLLQQAAAAAMAELEDQWKRATLLHFEQRGQLLAQATLEGLGDLVALRRALQQTAAIRRIEILSVSRREARFLLHLLGEPTQLALALAQRGVELNQDGETWRLRVRQTTGAR